MNAFPEGLDPDLLLLLILQHMPVAGRTVLAQFIEGSGPKLSDEERAWAASLQSAWFGIWEVTAIEPGASITMHDVLSGATRTVREVGASRLVRVRDALLVRVVDHEGRSVLCGLHPRTLGPLAADRVRARLQKRIRVRGHIPEKKLRDAAVTLALVTFWDEAVRDEDARRATIPQLANTDGEPLLLTVDHFVLAPGSGPRLAAALAGQADVAEPASDDEPRRWTFLEADETVLGVVRVEGSSVRLETNSVERADRLRARLQGLCAGALRHRARTHQDPAAALGDPGAKSRQRPAVGLPPEADAMVRQFKARHYATWADEPLPAFGDRTARVMARTAAGRHQVDVLLRDMERTEQSSPPEQRFDFGPLRRSLGLDP